MVSPIKTLNVLSSSSQYLNEVGPSLFRMNSLVSNALEISSLISLLLDSLDFFYDFILKIFQFILIICAISFLRICLDGTKTLIIPATTETNMITSKIDHGNTKTNGSYVNNVY